MNNLNIASTETSPQINFDVKNGQLKLIGKSFPDNPFQFYKPVLAWVSCYIDSTDNKNIHLTIELSYCNSSTLKVLFDMFDLLAEAKKNDMLIHISWIYASNNHTMHDIVEDFETEFKDIVIKRSVFDSP